MDYSKLKLAIKQRGFTEKAFADKLGITQNGFRAMVNNHTMSIKTLEKISEILEVPMTYFFDDSDGKLPAPKSFNEKDLAKCKQQVIDLQAELLEVYKSLRK